jgi:N-hydroxyarylamine O-acetyltransferase
MLAVPFENINVQNGMPVSVEINDLYDKLFRNRIHHDAD